MHDELDPVSLAGSDAADHVAEARRRARTMLGGEAHLGPVDDWRRLLVSARDTLVLTFLAWILLERAVGHGLHGALLVAFALGIAIVFAISTGRATAAQVAYYASELERERREIRENFEHECSEIRALYAAKGFREPLLSQVVDTLSADDDRLLKVMMEEELGLSMHHVNHPLLVGAWNFAAAAVAGLILAVPVGWVGPAVEAWWIIGAGAGLLAGISWLAGRTTHRSGVAMFASSIITAVVAGGTVYYLVQWLAPGHPG